MNDEMKWRCIGAMKTYGGGFVKALAEAWALADAPNAKRIEDAFPEYVERYCAMAAKLD